MSAFQRNLLLAFIIGGVAAFLFLWGCPRLAVFGHERLCLVLYALLMVIYVIGRAQPERSRKSPPDDLASRRGGRRAG